MAGQAAAILAGADLIPAWGMDVWNSSALLPENSLTGRTLHVLIGYSERPSGVQVVAYAAVLAALLTGGTCWPGGTRSPRPARRPPALELRTKSARRADPKRLRPGSLFRRAAPSPGPPACAAAI